MKKLFIIPLILTGCIHKIDRVPTSDYECKSTIINYRSMNDDPLFDYPNDTSYSEYNITNIEDTAISKLTEHIRYCFEGNDTLILRSQVGANTYAVSTTVIIKDWNKLE